MEYIETSQSRVIGHYRGAEPGPLVIALGGIHGNEPAGVQGLERLFDLLAEEPYINPTFSFKGELLALRGNLSALAAGVRYIETDLNRIWEPAERRKKRPRTKEDQELDELLAVIEHAIAESPLSDLVLLDLHTTTADGGLFAITGDDDPSLSLAVEMYVPVVKGMLDGLQGTTLEYFRTGHATNGRPVRAVVFESGNHYDPASVDLAVAGTINLLRALGCVRDEDVNTLHDEKLREASAALPRMTELVYVHNISKDGSDHFQMKSGYHNFQRVRQGEELAHDRHGPIYCPVDGFLLMPLYQKLGKEGFFIVKEYQKTTAF
jgi:succinylglutamate desuccinylase